MPIRTWVLLLTALTFHATTALASRQAVTHWTLDGGDPLLHIYVTNISTISQTIKVKINSGALTSYTNGVYGTNWTPTACETGRNCVESTLSVQPKKHLYLSYKPDYGSTGSGNFSDRGLIITVEVQEEQGAILASYRWNDNPAGSIAGRIDINGGRPF